MPPLDVEAPKAPKASTEKKPVVPLDVQVVTDLKSIPKKLTKEEEARRAREMTARFREAAKESKKVGMEAAAEAPSWAKAVTPPSTTSAGARPVRTKKPAVDRPSIASSGNKPIWEKSPDEMEEPRARGSKRTSMAQQIARGGQRPEEDNASAPAPEIEERTQPQRPQDPSALPIWSRPADGDGPAWNRPPEIEQPDWNRPSEHHAQQRNTWQGMNNGVSSFASSERDERDYGEPAREIQVPSYDDQNEYSGSSLVESVDDVLAAARAQREREEVPYELQSQVSYEEPAPEAYEIPAPQPEVLYEDEYEDARADSGELPEVIPEVTDGDDENTMATITFSFNKKNAPVQKEPQAPSASAIPRHPDEYVQEEHSRSLMDSEYDRGVLPGVIQESEEKLHSDEDEEEHKRKVSEFYIGRDANDRPLSMRPAAPLAQARDDVYVEEVDHSPEDDINNRPLATRPLAPLAKVTEVVPNIEYIKERGIESIEEEDIHQIPSLASSQRWGEMPEAKETPSWAKPQDSDSDSPFAGRGRRRPARDAEDMRPSRDAETMRPAGRPAARRPQEEEEEQVAPTRPGAGRPGMSRPTAERPSSRRAAEEQPKKQVPIWERVPEDDGRPAPAWGSSTSSSSYRLGDERPAGALTKPKGQIIDVEKPREKPSTLLGGERQVKEILPSGEAREFSSNPRKRAEYDDSAREVLPSSQRDREEDRVRERPIPPYEREEERGASPFAAAREDRPAREEPSREAFRPRPAFDHGDQPDNRAIFAPPRSEGTRPSRPSREVEPDRETAVRESAGDSNESPRFRRPRSEAAARERVEAQREKPRPAFDHGDQPDNRAIFAPPRSSAGRDEAPARESRMVDRQPARPAERRVPERPTERQAPARPAANREFVRQNGNPPPRRVEVQMPSQRPASDRPIPQRPPVRRPSAQEMMEERAAQRPAQRPGMRPGSEYQDERPVNEGLRRGQMVEEEAPEMNSERPRTFAQRRQMEEDIPSLARGAADPVRQNVAREEETARRAMRGLPDYDPDGPSPFKPN